ncbi:MAG: hypothetical protein ACJA1I_000540 [Zhongshania marina]
MQPAPLATANQFLKSQRAHELKSSACNAVPPIRTTTLGAALNAAKRIGQNVQQHKNLNMEVAMTNAATEYGMLVVNKVCDKLFDDHFSRQEQLEERHDKADLYPHRAKPRKPTMTRTMTVHVEIEVDLDIDASWSNGFPGSQEEPPEPKGYELHGFTAMYRGADVTDLVSDADVQELINEAD